MLKAVANIIDIEENVVIGKLYKNKEELIAKPNNKTDSKLPFVYYYKRKLYDKIQLAMELGILDEMKITDKLIKETEDIFNTRYNVIKF